MPWCTQVQIDPIFEMREFFTPINAVLFSRGLFPSCPLCWSPLRHSSSPFLGTFRPSFLSKNGLCFSKLDQGAQHRVWRGGSFRMDLSTKFGRRIPSRNLREKRSASADSLSEPAPPFQVAISWDCQPHTDQKSLGVYQSLVCKICFPPLWKRAQNEERLYSGKAKRGA